MRIRIFFFIFLNYLFVCLVAEKVKKMKILIIFFNG
jgi:hypothetical protein